jgi:integrase
MANVVETLKGKSLIPFFSAFKSAVTKENYTGSLRHFLNFSKLSADEFVAKSKKKPKNVELLFLQYVEHRKEEGVSGSTITMAKDALKLLLEMNDVQVANINWTKMNRVIPPVMHYASDRPPSADEIRQLLIRVGLPMKVIVLLLISSGMRIGALRYLRWQDLEQIERDGATFAKLRVYAGEPEEYVTFITPEAYGALLEYRKMRESKGERITGSSPLIIQRISEASLAKGTEVRPANPKTIRNVIGRVWAEIAADREKNTVGRSNRYDFKQVHGFRKFFKTTCERSVKSIYVEMFLGHTLGISSSYMKPSQEDMISEYVKAIPALTILSHSNEVTYSEIENKMKEQLLVFSDWIEEDIKGLGDLSKYSIQELKELDKKKEFAKLGLNGHSTQKIVPWSELRQHITNGWELVQRLDDTNEAIVRLPK